ncbi:hypothetical protein QAD02_003692 [Eretmocerus hayati]|uniref:Uncharacterized protein n=1 Tax=Eretmocerus hayati TaxID=131215 RepID=A0ACC2NNI8_9HYME|nr:hypothetical protein QAD02_003692 [Eretmocerus hayati]
MVRSSKRKSSEDDNSKYRVPKTTKTIKNTVAKDTPHNSSDTITSTLPNLQESSSPSKQIHPINNNTDDQNTDSSDDDKTLETYTHSMKDIIDYTSRVKILSKNSVSMEGNVEGLYFNFQFTDGSTTTRGVVFGEDCSKIYEMLKPQMVYDIKLLKINSINPRYRNGYGIILGKDTVIDEQTGLLHCIERDYQFQKVEQILTATVGTFIEKIFCVI